MQIGIDLGASKIESVILDEQGNEKHRERVDCPKNDNFAEVEVNPELHEYIGHEQIITFNYCGQEILGKFSSSVDISFDKKMNLFIDLNSVSIFDQDTKRRI